MQLLEGNNNGEFSLTRDFGNDIPRYAILSHTWGADSEEVTFKDLMDGTGKSKAGYDKIRFCGKQARRDGLQYFWVDTCCIDKSDSSKLAEAITSMFRWYRNAAKCYVYLSDVSINDDQVDPSLQSWQSAFRNSRWFTRGWTLQELIAPLSVEFFCSDGKRLGDKKSLERQLHEITGIAVPALQGTSPSEFSVEERMSWAGNRETKREEDKAYSLLGIFNIHMLPMYGEGAENAFSRLEEEFYKHRKKRQHNELSIISQAPFNSTKRSKASHSPSGRYLNLIDPEPSFDYEYSMHHNNQQEAGKEPVTNVNHSIDATTKQSLIEQLYFTKIDERLTSLTAAQGSTCRWFLTKPEYISWHDMTQQLDHDGFLWIKGNPGTGKSTLMKFLFEEVRFNAKNESSQIILSFFFLARGTVEEKSTTGLYRSLLHQLFEKAAELKDSLEWMTANGARVIQRNGWQEEALKQTLAHAVEKLGNRSLTIFVDALDECDKNQAADMICFFEELCDRAREARVRLQICFSSRHYPTIVIQKGIEVILEDEIGHSEDIKNYIKSKLRLGKSKQAESLRTDILEKSSSIFLWVVLVLDILNSEYPNNSVSIKKIRERLKEIPPKLTDLFEMILTRDRENLERLQACLKWILFAVCPLKPQELYFAIQLSLDKECSSYWDQEDVDLDQIKTFVRSSSKGLAEVTRNKASEVQFIHESVRDFLLGKYKSQWSGVSSNFEGHSHEVLRDCCLAQLNADPLSQASKAVEMSKTIRVKFPFLEYSVINVLYHANGAQQNGIKQAGFLADFPLQQWVSLNNTLEKNSIRRYTESVSMLYIFAEKNLADLIRVHPHSKSCFSIENERYGLPFFAALATKSSEAICEFLDIQAESQPSKSLLHNLCKQYCQDRKKWANFGRSFHFSQRRSVSSYAAEYGDEILLSLLIESGECMPDSKDKNGRTPLYWASQNRHVDVVQLLLEKGADVNATDQDGRTPLYWASRNGHVDVVKLLLEKEADVNATDQAGRTPLYWASQNGHVDVVKLLLEKEADVNATDQDRRTLLYWASQNRHVDVVQLLLEKGADVNAADEAGRTPLYWVSQNGHVDVIKLLLEKEADVNATDQDERTSLHWASQNRHVDVVKLLLEKGADVNATDQDRRTLLHWASRNGNVDVVKLLLEKGADVNAADQDGRTPLHWASLNEHVDVVKLLLEKGADVNAATNSSGRTPLYWASLNGHVDVVQLLLEKGADINATDQDGRTPLYWASQNGHVDVVKLLFEKEADVNATDQDRRTLLYWASQNRHVDVVKLLLEKGADVNATDQDERTPLHWVSRNGNVDVVKLLLEKEADVNAADQDGRTPLYWASLNKHVDVVKLLLEKGADVNAATNSSGRTPLYWASLNGHVDVVKLLLEKEADVNAATNSSGRTLLHWASLNEHVDVVKLLLEKGADVNAATNSSGQTLLHWASQNGHVDVVKLLLEKGADVNAATNSSGRTPLYWASRNGHVDVVKLLLEKEADVNATDQDGPTLLHWASLNKYVDVVKLLLEKEADVNATDQDGRTLLHWASQNEHVDVVKLLLEKGADINAATNSSGRTPLYWASRNGHVDVVKLLLEKEADVNATDQDGRTLLYWASQNEHVDVVKLLLEKGIDVNATDQDR